LGGAIESVIRKGLSKRADSRYRNCQEFIESLEKACEASKGWKLMPRGGVLNAPTMADVASAGAPPKLPPPRRPRHGETTATVTAPKKRGFLPFLVGVCLVAGALIGFVWQAGPWILSGMKKPQPPTQQQAQRQEPPRTVPAMPGDSKPSPVGPAAGAPPAETPATPPVETKSAQEDPARKIEEPAKPEPVQENPALRGGRAAPVVRGAAAQDVMVVSSPGGATATLDGNPNNACKTPCTLQAAPGRHTVGITMPGQQIEYREITVGGSPIEMPPVMLRPAGGTLMLSSEPPGAAVIVDGKKIDMVTPAQIPLALGSYSIMVEKDGRHATERVEIKSGINYRRITMGQ
jgi:hypothetical protein